MLDELAKRIAYVTKGDPAKIKQILHTGIVQYEEKTTPAGKVCGIRLGIPFLPKPELVVVSMLMSLEQILKNVYGLDDPWKVILEVVEKKRPKESPDQSA